MPPHCRKFSQASGDPILFPFSYRYLLPSPRRYRPFLWNKQKNHRLWDSRSCDFFNLYSLNYTYFPLNLHIGIKIQSTPPSNYTYPPLNPYIWIKIQSTPPSDYTDSPLNPYIWIKIQSTPPSDYTDSPLNSNPCIKSSQIRPKTIHFPPKS